MRNFAVRILLLLAVCLPLRAQPPPAPAPLQSARFFHVSLTAKDKEALVSWYKEKLGFAELFRNELPEIGASVVFLQLNDYKIEIVHQESSRLVPRKKPPFHTLTQGYNCISLRVDDVDQLVTYCRAQRIPITSGPDTLSTGYKVVFIEDPEGNPVEFIQTVKK